MPGISPTVDIVFHRRSPVTLFGIYFRFQLSLRSLRVAARRLAVDYRGGHPNLATTGHGVVVLASNDANFVTGINLLPDGGWTEPELCNDRQERQNV